MRPQRSIKRLSKQLKLFPRIFNLYLNPFVYYGDKFGLSKNSEIITLELRNGLKFKIHGGNSDINTITEIFLSDGYHAIFENIPTAGVFVDVGANIGILSVAAAARMPKGKIFSFEPNPEVLPLLNENIALNGMRQRIRAFPWAVAGSSGERKLYFEDGHWGGATLLKENKRETREFLVRSIGVNEMADAIGERLIDYLKIDVEGGEGEIVDAMNRETAERIGSLFVEHHEPRVFLPALKANLANLGFELVREFQWPPSLLFIRGRGSSIGSPGSAVTTFPPSRFRFAGNDC